MCYFPLPLRAVGGEGHSQYKTANVWFIYGLFLYFQL